MATARDERTIGLPPYDESAAIEAARQMGRSNMSLRAILGRALQGGALQAGMAGLASVPRGANFGTAFLASMGGAAKAQMGLDQQRAMEGYRQQQLEVQRSQEERLSREKPEKPTPEPYGNAPWYMRPEYRDTPEGMAARKKAEHIAQGRTPAGPKPPKPTVIRRRVPSGKDAPTEQDIIDAIDQSNDPDALTIYVTGRGAADSADIRRAAQLRIGQILRQRR